MSHNFGYNFIRFICFFLIVLILYFAVSTVSLSSLSTYIGSVTIGGSFDQWSEGASPDGSVYNDGLGQFNDAFSGMLYNIAKILSYTHGIYNNAVTTNSYLAQIYTKVYDTLDTLVNHASIVSSNFTLVRSALDGISGYLSNIMSYTASTRDNTLAIADRLMYNNLSAAEYLDSINSHASAANNQIRTLHTDFLNSNRYLTEINGKLSYTYPDQTVHSISDIVYNNGVGQHTDLNNIKELIRTSNNYLSNLNINWNSTIDNNLTYYDNNFNEISSIYNLNDFYIYTRNFDAYEQFDYPFILKVNLPIRLNVPPHYDLDYNVYIGNLVNNNFYVSDVPFKVFTSVSGTSIYILVNRYISNLTIHFTGSTLFISNNYNLSPYLSFLNNKDQHFYELYDILFQQSNLDYLKSIDSHLEDIHFTLNNPLVSYDDSNKVNVDISGSDTQSTGNIITKLRNMFSTGVTSGQFITTLDDTSFYQFFTSQIDSDLNDLSTTYNEPVY